MTSYTLLCPNGFRAHKILIAAKVAGLSINRPDFTMGKDHTSAAFKAKNPMCKVPVLDTPQGSIAESNAILRHVARQAPASGLYGNSSFQQAKVDQWLDLVANEVEVVRSVWYYTVLGALPYNGKAHLEAKKETQNVLKLLDQHLLNHTYLAETQTMTIADLSLFVALVDVYGKLLEPSFVQSIPNLTRWFNTIAHQHAVQSVIPKVEFAKEEQQPADAAGAKKAAKSETKTEAPKADSKPAAASAEDLMDELESSRSKKPKSELDLLPESQMVLDTTKKLMFSKRPILPDFFEQLWTFFDPKGYSWYTADYQYNTENKVFYMTGNAVGGFLQRCDAVRKYAIGVMNIVGNKDEETPPFSISGCWMFRGDKVPKEMLEENPDSEYYTWKKLDTLNEADRKLIKNQFMAEQLNGIDVLDRRFFK